MELLVKEKTKNIKLNESGKKGNIMCKKILLLCTKTWRFFVIQTSFHSWPFVFHTQNHMMSEIWVSITMTWHMHNKPCTLCLYGMYIYARKTFIFVLTPQQQLCYQYSVYCTYWTVLGSFNNWNIIALSQKSTTSAGFEEIYQVVLYGISDNTDSLVQSV